MIDRSKPVPVKYDEIHNPMVREEMRDLASRCRDELENPIRRSISLGEFTSKWANLFLAKVDPATNNRKEGIPVALWCSEVSVNPYTWVDVIGQNNEVVFSVPPLMNSDAVKLSNINFYHHVMELQAMADHGSPLPEMENYRQQHILRFFESDPNADTYLEAMNKMAVFYGYAPFTALSKDGKTILPTGEVVEGDLLGAAKKDDKSTGFGEAVRVDEF